MKPWRSVGWPESLQSTLPSLEQITRGWSFDGRQHDAAEFLLKILPNLHPHQLGSWETRAPIEAGVIVDEEGTAPIHLDVQVDNSFPQMLQPWTLQALLKPTQHAYIALPRFVGRRENCAAVTLHESSRLPFFAGAELMVVWVSQTQGWHCSCR